MLHVWIFYHCYYCFSYLANCLLYIYIYIYYYYYFLLFLFYIFIIIIYYLFIHTHIYIHMYTCIFLFFEKRWPFGCYAWTLERNLISDIRVVIVTYNNCSLLACLFKVGFHISQCNPRSQFCPFSIIFVKAEKQRERRKKKRKRERNLTFFSLVSASPRGEIDKTPPFAPSFLDFRHQWGEKKRKNLFFFFFCVILPCFGITKNGKR